MTATTEAVSLECPVCMLEFNLEVNIPQDLSCPHIFCKSCVDRIEENSTVLCPLCREVTELSAVTTNFALSEMLTDVGDLTSRLRTLRRLMSTSARQIEDTTVIDSERYRFDQTLGEIKKAVRKQRQPLNELEDQLEQRVRNLWEENTHRYSEWASELGQVTRHAGPFVEKAEKVMRSLHTGISVDRIRGLDVQCKALVAKLEQITSHQPQLTEYKFDKVRHTTRAHLIRKSWHDEMFCFQAKDRPNPKVGELICRDSDRKLLQVSSGATWSHTGGRTVDYRRMKFLSMTGAWGSKNRVAYRIARGMGLRGLDKQHFMNPWDVTTDKENIYVSDSWNHRIKVYDHSLRPLWATGYQSINVRRIGGRAVAIYEDKCEYEIPVGVAVGHEGQLFVADCGHNEIEDRDNCNRFGERGNGPCQFNSPKGLAVGPGGDLYVCDSENKRVQVLSPDGSFVRCIGEEGSGVGQFENEVWDVSVTSSRVIATEPGSKQLKVFTLQGDFVEMWPKGLPDMLNNAFINAVNSDKHDNVIISCARPSCLAVLDPQGHYVCTIGSEGHDPGEFYLPQGVTVTVSGDLVVCDRGNHRIQLWAEN